MCCFRATARPPRMQIASLLQKTEFDYETTRLLTTAFEEAWSIMNTTGGPLVADGQSSLTRTILAQHIIDMAMQGERDLDRLVDSALERLTGAPDGATN
jgi:hypothetical protein